MKKRYIVTKYDNEDDVEVKSYEFTEYSEAKSFIERLFNFCIKEAALYAEVGIDERNTFEPCIDPSVISPHSIITFEDGSKIEFFFSELFDAKEEEL